MSEWDTEIVGSSDIRWALATDPATSPDRIALLVEDAAGIVRRGALENPSLPAWAMEKFLNRAKLNQGHTENPWTGTEMFQDLKSLACNPNITEVMLRRVVTSPLYGDGRGGERFGFLVQTVKHANCPPEILAWVVASENETTVLAAAENPWLTDEQARTLLTKPTIMVSQLTQRRIIMLLIRNPNVSIDFLFGLVPELGTAAVMALTPFLDESRAEICVLAVLNAQEVEPRTWGANRVRDPRWQRTLACSPIPQVRVAVAENPHVTAELVSLLCHDSDPLVRKVASRNVLASEEDRVLVALMPGLVFLG